MIFFLLNISYAFSFLFLFLSYFFTSLHPIPLVPSSLHFFRLDLPQVRTSTMGVFGTFRPQFDRSTFFNLPSCKRWIYRSFCRWHIYIDVSSWSHSHPSLQYVHPPRISSPVLWFPDVYIAPDYYGVFGRSDRRVYFWMVTGLLALDWVHSIVSCMTVYKWTVSDVSLCPLPSCFRHANVDYLAVWRYHEACVSDTTVHLSCHTLLISIYFFSDSPWTFAVDPAMTGIAASVVQVFCGSFNSSDTSNYPR